MSKQSRMQEFRASMGPTVKELRFMLHRIMKSPLSLIGSSIVVFFAIIALLAPVLAPPNPAWARIQFPDPFKVPQWLPAYVPNPTSPQLPNEAHPFGTAENGYDLFYGMIWGTITAFRIGIWTTFASLAIGLSIGVIAAYYGGIIDEIMMRFTDIIMAFPGLILAMAFVTALGHTLENVLLALVLVSWPGYTRLIRGEIMRIKQEDYVEAAKAVGCSDTRVILRHILPNSIYPIVISATLDIGTMVLAAAALSFLGLGTEGYADWGFLVNLSRGWIGIGQNAFPHTFVIPGVFIFTFSLGWNLLGDAFRDIMDPTIRRR